MDSAKKKILVPILNRAHLGRLKSVLQAIDHHPQLKLQIMVGLPAAYGSFVANIKHSRPHSWSQSLPWYIRARLLSFAQVFKKNVYSHNDFLAKSIAQSGFKIDSYVPLFFDGGVSETMAKSVGFGLNRIVDELKRLKPDIVFVNADRFEMMAVALAATYLNIPVAHNEGGDVSGTLDESIRHAITKLSHIHLTSTEGSRKRVIQMGENPDLVFTVGSPAIDSVLATDLNFTKEIFPNFKPAEPYLLVLAHPVVTESNESNAGTIKNILKVSAALEMQTIVLGSNIDAGSADIGKILRTLKEEKSDNIFLAKNLPSDDFYRLIGQAACLIGNSSSFIREGAYLGTPAVIVGSRQQNRERGSNVIEVPNDEKQILTAVQRQLAYGRYTSDTRFGDGKSGERIASILAIVSPQIQKKFTDLI